MGKLDGQVAIVTGAGRGLGRGYALRLASLGARVAVVDRDLHSYEEYKAEQELMTADSTAQEIRDAGGEAIDLTADVANVDEVHAMVDATLAKWNRVDVLVTNAGGGIGTPEETAASVVDLDVLEQVMRSNLYGTMYSCMAVAPTMKEQKSGRIITVSSMAGLGASSGGGYAHYGTAKGAIIAYTRYLAQELGPYGINVNCIAPGLIGTGRLMQRFEPREEQLRNSVALRRIGTVEDCAKVVEFLATDLSDYLAGTVISIDGGIVR